MATRNINLRVPIAMTLAETRIAALLLTGFLMPVVACSASSASDDGRWLPYEPTVVELRGILEIQMEFGPPNYGEDPATDARLEVPMLLLESPVSVRGDPYDQTDNATVTNMRKLQLIFLSGAEDYRHLIGKSVAVAGTLSEAMTGHHFTPVVLTVKEIREDR